MRHRFRIIFGLDNLCMVSFAKSIQSCSRVGSTRGSGRVRSGPEYWQERRVGSRPWRVGSGPSTLTRPDPPCFSKPVNVNFNSDTQPTLCKLFPIIQKIFTILEMNKFKRSLVCIVGNCMLNFRRTIVTGATPVNKLYVIYLNDN